MSDKITTSFCDDKWQENIPNPGECLFEAQKFIACLCGCAARESCDF